MNITRRELIGAALAGAAAFYLSPILSASRVFAGPEIEPTQQKIKYAVLVSHDTSGEKDWARVAGTLKDKYGARVVVFRDDIEEARDALKEEIPTHIAYVAQPEELSIPLLSSDNGSFDMDSERQVTEGSGTGRFNRLLSSLDDSGYSACIRGVVTGMTPEDALLLALAERLDIDNVLMKTSNEMLRYLPDGFFYSDGPMDYKEGEIAKRAVRLLEKRKGQTGKPKWMDSSEIDILQKLRSDQIDFVTTSGHATYNRWMVDYGKTDSDFFSADDQGGIVLADRNGNVLRDNNGDILRVESTNPKIWYGAGNCQLGRIKSRNESFALSLIHSAGVVQLAGYLNDNWHGAAGWPIRGHLIGSDRPTIAEAVYMNTIGLQFAKRKLEDYRRDHKLRRGNEESGKVYDQHNFVLYGDPGLEAKLVGGEPRMTKTMETERRDDRNFYRLTARAEQNHTLDGSLPIFPLPRGFSPKNVTASNGLKYFFGPNFVVFDVGNEVIVEGGEAKITNQEITAGTEWTLEFTT